jgi:hypothetical protein
VDGPHGKGVLRGDVEDYVCARITYRPVGEQAALTLEPGQLGELITHPGQALEHDRQSVARSIHPDAGAGTEFMPALASFAKLRRGQRTGDRNVRLTHLPPGSMGVYDASSSGQLEVKAVSI